jgi:probable selenium-dependent hydroxylase accessory protein YqeC
MAAGTLTLTAALGVGPGDVVAFVGGGGKTTAMLRLATEIASAGGRVVTTTTTRLAASEVPLAPVHVRTIDALPAALATARHVLLTGAVDALADKALGVAPEALCALQLPGTTLLIEADGSRRLPFKAPGAHEPVIPACSTLVVPVVGIDAVGKPLNARHVHRPERVSRIHAGATVTPEMIAAVMTDPRGGCKNVPAGARVVLLINKVDNDVRRRLARDIAVRVLDTGPIAAVALAALTAGGHPVLEVLRR